MVIGGSADLVNDPEPFPSVISPLPRPVLTAIPPVAPAAPGWMCAPVNTVFAGKPVIVTTNSDDVTPVIALAESLVTLIVKFITPVALESAFVTGGTSFEA